MREEGYIKYTSRLCPEAPASAAVLDGLNRARTALFDRGLIGMYPDGIGYGNCSVRHAGSFYITGSATGHLRVLTPAHYTRVERVSPSENRVWAYGAIPASSESMSHGVLYEADPGIHTVIHVHSRLLFDGLLASGRPRTPPEILYGTPHMAEALQDVVRTHRERPGVCVMAGHEEGVIAYGSDVESVFEQLLALLDTATGNGGTD